MTTSVVLSMERESWAMMCDFVANVGTRIWSRKIWNRNKRDKRK